jgi:hypothetical protein
MIGVAAAGSRPSSAQVPPRNVDCSVPSPSAASSAQVSDPRNPARLGPTPWRRLPARGVALRPRRRDQRSPTTQPWRKGRRRARIHRPPPPSRGERSRSACFAFAGETTPF